MKFPKVFAKFAPGLLGAFFLSATACKEKDASSDWSGQAPAAPAPAPAAPVPPVVAEVAAKPDPAAAEPLEESSGVRFISYNVQNWLTMDRQVGGRNVKGAPKPEPERLAIAELLADAKPDILGVSEIGTPEDVKDLQKYLANAGLPLPHFHHTRGVDPTRSLVLLSRFPIGKTVEHAGLSYRSKGRDYQMQRGILDATVDTPVGAFRFVGVHLKSKREIEEGDQADMRLNEAHLLRRELDAILEQDPAARLVVYGDFNDTRQSPTVRAIRGSGRNPKALMPVALKDSRGHFWTHHWAFEDLYSRIDYVMLSDSLRKSVDWDGSGIIDNDAVAGASDHRPLLVVLK